MRRIFLILFLIYSSYPVQAQPGSISWYRSYSGSIGKYMITMHLHKIGHEYYGYYYYDRVQQPIFMTGNDTVAGDGKISMLAFTPGTLDMTETFTLSMARESLSGVWQKDEKGKAIPVSLAETTNRAPRFELVYTEGSVKLRPSLDDSPSASYLAASVWPDGNTRTANFIKTIVNEGFGANRSQEEIGKILLAGKKKVLSEYLEENKDLADSLFTDYPSAYSLAEEQKLSIAFHSPKLLTLASHFYTYTGGAHGNYGTSFITIDLVASKKLSLTNVMTPAGIKGLRSELEKQFRQQAGLKANEPLTEAGLFENKIEPNDNFYLTGKGIGFSYMPYEIGPYALGEINVFIPFSRLANQMQPSLKELILP